MLENADRWKKYAAALAAVFVIGGTAKGTKAANNIPAEPHADVGHNKASSAKATKTVEKKQKKTAEISAVQWRVQKAYDRAEPIRNEIKTAAKKTNVSEALLLAFGYHTTRFGPDSREGRGIYYFEKYTFISLVLKHGNDIKAILDAENHESAERLGKALEGLNLAAAQARKIPKSKQKEILALLDGNNVLLESIAAAEHLKERYGGTPRSLKDEERAFAALLSQNAEQPKATVAAVQKAIEQPTPKTIEPQVDDEPILLTEVVTDPVVAASKTSGVEREVFQPVRAAPTPQVKPTPEPVKTNNPFKAIANFFKKAFGRKTPSPERVISKSKEVYGKDLSFEPRRSNAVKIVADQNGIAAKKAANEIAEKTIANGIAEKVAENGIAAKVIENGIAAKTAENMQSAKADAKRKADDAVKAEMDRASALIRAAQIKAASETMLKKMETERQPPLSFPSETAKASPHGQTVNPVPVNDAAKGAIALPKKLMNSTVFREVKEMYTRIKEPSKKGALSILDIIHVVSKETNVPPEVMLTLAFRETRGRPELYGHYLGMYQSTVATYIEHTLKYGPYFLEKGVLDKYDPDGAKELRSILDILPFRIENGKKIYGPYEKVSDAAKKRILKLAKRPGDVQTVMSGLYFAQHLIDRCPDIKRLKDHFVFLHRFYGVDGDDHLKLNGRKLQDAQVCFVYFLKRDENKVAENAKKLSANDFKEARSVTGHANHGYKITNSATTTKTLDARSEQEAFQRTGNPERPVMKFAKPKVNTTNKFC